MTTILFVGATILAVLGHGYFWVAIVNRLHGYDSSKLLKDGGTLACLLLFAIIPLVLLWDWREVYSGWNATWSQSAGISARYFQSCVIWCLGEFVVKALFSKSKNDPQTLLQLNREHVDTSSLSKANLVHGNWAKLLSLVPGNEACRLVIEHKRIAVSNLDPKLVGLKIAHISDLHLTGRIDKSYFQMAIDQVNQLEADVVIITGDIVEHPSCEPWLQDTVGRLRAAQGVYFILGNHDRYVDAAKTRQILSDAGQICLSGQSLETRWNDATVLLAANERPWFSELPDLEKTDSQAGGGRPLMLFVLHSPDQFDWAQQHSADLVVAGHTHGGQICFPLLGAVACPSKYGTRYTDGVYRKDDSVMHVTRGVSGRMPLRWFCPPEIAILELATNS